MKFKSIIITSLISLNLAAQSSEVSLNYNFGIPTENLRTEYFGNVKAQQGKNGNNYGIQRIFDNTVTLKYGHLLWKKHKLFYSFGFEYGIQKNYFPISPEGIVYDNIVFKSVRTEYEIGLYKRVSFWDNKLSLDVGFQLAYRNPKWDELSFAATEYESTYNTVTVSYDYDVYQTPNKLIPVAYNPKILNTELYLKANFQIKPRVTLNFGLQYSFNYFALYNNKYTVNFYELGTTNLLYALGVETAPGNLFTNVTDYFYLTTGLKYEFDWSELKRKKRD